jgi:hypothetical protein
VDFAAFRNRVSELPPVVLIEGTDAQRKLRYCLQKLLSGAQEGGRHLLLVDKLDRLRALQARDFADWSSAVAGLKRKREHSLGEGAVMRRTFEQMAAEPELSGNTVVVWPAEQASDELVESLSHRFEKVLLPTEHDTREERWMELHQASRITLHAEGKAHKQALKMKNHRKESYYNPESV